MVESMILHVSELRVLADLADSLEGCETRIIAVGEGKEKFGNAFTFDSYVSLLLYRLSLNSSLAEATRSEKSLAIRNPSTPSLSVRIARSVQ